MADLLDPNFFVPFDDEMAREVEQGQGLSTPVNEDILLDDALVPVTEEQLLPIPDAIAAS